MGLALVEERDTTVLKDYKDTDRSRYFSELKAYQELSWATPALMGHGEFWIEMERLVPILSLGPEWSRKYKAQLRALYQDLHDAGYWHCDADLSNVVIHPVRGPLLIDFENLSEASGPISYDLYGAQAAGVEPAWPDKGGDGVFWSLGGPSSPSFWWS